jgi:manganese-dependent inorganic pyrophosphatase
LSHFSIILREKKIPAIVYKEKISLKDNDMINIDASSENIKSYERLSSGKSCVTSYVNPDLDGIVSSIVYAYYKTSKGNYNIPVYFGKLDNETIFALNHFKVAFPQKVLLVDEFETVTIVDTHNLVQLSQNFPTDKVVEILDHHTDGNLADFPNATINNEKIGAVCTMIAEYFKNEKTLIPEHIAGLLALGIVSNTLNFTAPSTTQRDKDAFSWLKLFVCITDDLIKQLFESRSSIDNLESSVIIANNMKEFVWGSAKIGISQVEMIDVNKLIDRSDFENSLLQIKENKNLDCIIFSGVDIFSHKTHIVVLDNETLDIVNKGMGYNFSSSRMIVDKILLRKTDFIPNLKNYFENQ